MTVRSAERSARRTATPTAATCEDIFQTFAFALFLSTEATRPPPGVPPPTDASCDRRQSIDCGKARRSQSSPPQSTPQSTPPRHVTVKARRQRQRTPAPIARLRKARRRKCTPPQSTRQSTAPKPDARGGRIGGARCDCQRAHVSPSRVDAFGGFLAGSSPSLAVGARRANVEIEWTCARIAFFLADASRWRICRASFDARPLPSVNTRYGVQAGRVDACPVAALRDSCAHACGWRVGRLQLKEFDVPGASLENDLWATTEVALLVRWSPFAPLFVELEGAVGRCAITTNPAVFPARISSAVPRFGGRRRNRRGRALLVI